MRATAWHAACNCQPLQMIEMNLPFFYTIEAGNNSETIVLDEDNSRHAVSVLRMQQGEALYLTDGKGHLLSATIADAHKKKCRLTITGTQYTPPPERKTAIAISLVKNPVRFEWFLEKATEIGITEIFPLLCQRTEKQHVRQDRMNNVLISALLQSRQTWLPVLHEPVKFEKLVTQSGYNQLFIAHCLNNHKENLGGNTINQQQHQLVLIGPEGDFTPAEIDSAMKHHFTPVALGSTRLRTETAGIVAAVLLKN